LVKVATARQILIVCLVRQESIALLQAKVQLLAHVLKVLTVGSVHQLLMHPSQSLVIIKQYIHLLPRVFTQGDAR
jgi:hypothetical protein